MTELDRAPATDTSKPSESLRVEATEPDLSPELLEVSLTDRWLRRGLIGAMAGGFALPYFRLLNRLDVTGKEILKELPKQRVVFLSNHQTYFTEAIAFFDVLYLQSGFRTEEPFLRFSAAEETMKKNLATSILAKSGAVTFRRSFRDAGVDVKRERDIEGLARVEQAIHSGWLLHFPAGTTRAGAPLRPGVAQLLHRTKAIAVPMRVDGFRQLMLHKQIPGRIGNRASIEIMKPLDLADFYAKPYDREEGAQVVARIAELISEAPDPKAEAKAAERRRSRE